MFEKRYKKWCVRSACPVQKHIGYYFSENSAREALDNYNKTGECMESDRIRRKRGNGTIGNHYGKYRARAIINKKRISKTFDTIEQCEQWLIKIKNNL